MPEGCKTAEYLYEIMDQTCSNVNPPEVRDVFARQNIDNSIIFILTGLKNLGKEGYIIDVNQRRITIEANEEAGFFYAVQTLMQMIGYNFALLTNRNTPIKYDAIISTVNACHIEDYPRFKYRGKHLDCARHFFTAEYIKRYIDLLAFHKINTFHWHLTDDQGWRIEIKKYPLLTQKGAYRNGTLIGHYSDRKESEHIYDTLRYGGFYTQDEIKEIVAYAASRHITVIPEIELPGHAQAALSAYPEYSCRMQPIEVCKTWGVMEDVFCCKEETFEFLQGVLDEVVQLFPSQYIHIGGDECPTVRWQQCPRCKATMQEKGLTDVNQIQRYFTERIENYLASKSRKIIGWDEILEKGVNKSATILSWQGEQGGINAAKQGNDAIMAPSAYLYFNFYQGAAATEPLSFGGFTPLKKTYLYEPVPSVLDKEQAKHIIGMQACTWTEYITDNELLEYNDLPRLAAMSERAWSKKQVNNYEDFVMRLERLIQCYERADLNYSSSHYAVQVNSTSKKSGIQIELSSALSDGKIYYRLDGKTPDLNSTEYKKPFTIKNDVVLTAFAFKDTLHHSPVLKTEYHINKATGRKYEMKDINPQYNGGGAYPLTDGIQGNKKSYDSWVGTLGKDYDVTLDLESATEINQISINFLDEQGSWIFLPEDVQFYVSDDKKTWKPLPQTVKSQVTDKENVFNYSVACKEKARYVKIHAKTIGNCPQHHPGAGYPSHMFGDEIIIK